MADKDFDYGLPQPGVMGTDPELHNRLVWYGVLHVDRTLKVKRYIDWLDYKEAGDSDLTHMTTRLFEASDALAAREEARRLIMAHVRF